MECAAVREFTGIHNMIRGLIRLMDCALSKADDYNAKQMAVLSDFGHFAIEGAHFHHRTEDDYYWPAVRKNGADPALLEPLVEEHRMIEPLLDEAEVAFAALKKGSVDGQTIESLREVVGRFEVGMLGHLDHEEPIFFPLLEQYVPDDQAERLAAQLAKQAPRQGISWLMGGVENAMTKEQAAEFLGAFPKPVVWLRPLMLRKYRSKCAVLGVDPATPAQR